jgi:hypothetical protein
MAMLERWAAHWRAAWWRLLWKTQGADYGWLLPALARLPLWLALALSGLRDRVNGLLHRDWRSMSLGFSHIAVQTRAAYQAIRPEAASSTVSHWVRGRFMTESRNEFEAELVNRGRVHEMYFTLPQKAEVDPFLLNREGKGLLLLIPHFDSFHLGTAFLGQYLTGSGRPIHAMSSAVFEDPRVHPAVQHHLNHKYQRIANYFNGGKVMHLEDGLRQFYKVLERGEILVVLGDSPPLPQGVVMEVPFLGARRTLAGGAIKMARRHNSQIGSFVCKNLRPGHYELVFSKIAPVDEARAVDDVYNFLSAQIRQNPQKWLAADLLPHMTEVTSR